MDISNHVAQRRVVTELERIVYRKPESLSAVGHNLRLFDCVNSQFTLQILVQFKEIFGVTRVSDDDCDDS